MVVGLTIMQTSEKISYMKNKGTFLFLAAAMLVLFLSVPASASVPSGDLLIIGKPPSDFVPGPTEIFLEVPEDVSGPSFFASRPDEMCAGSQGHDSGHVELLRPEPLELCSPLPRVLPVSKGICRQEVHDIFDIDHKPEKPLSPNLDFSTYKWNSLALKSVERNIRAFSEDITVRFSKYLKRSARYLDMMKGILKEEGVPEELAYLPLIESGYNVRAYSRSRAAGLWQFIAGTAKRYRLKINWWVDERRDPVKSTRAAARYLKDLHRMFGSWSLALASYNAGENRVKRVLRRSRSDNVWDLLLRTRHLRRETRDYVPKFIAARTIALDPEYYGFYDLKYLDKFAYDEVTLDAPLDLEAIAKCAGTTRAAIKELNPELRRWSTPPNVRSYTLRIPNGTQDEFLRKLAKIPKRERFDVRAYRVKAGDTVSRIARKTGVPARSIIAVNKLGRKALIRKGQKLLLPVPLGYSSRPLPRDLPIVVLPGGIKARKYKVRRGDTVSDLAIKAGVPPEEIVRVNKLRNGSLIRTGQTLYLPIGK